MLIEQDHIIDRWREYFSELINVERGREEEKKNWWSCMRKKKTRGNNKKRVQLGTGKNGKQ